MKAEILYKNHDDSNCEKFLKIVRFLYAKKIDIRPVMIHERCFPSNVNILPTISINNKLIVGLDEIIKYYEKITSINDLLNKSILFEKNNPNFRISEPPTHKNLII